MGDIEFIIPINRDSLLESDSGSYYVRNLCIASSIKDNLKQAQNAFKCDGPAYILENFDTYFSILYHMDKLDVDIFERAIHDLIGAFRQLHIHLQNTLEDSDMSSEIQVKTLNILKMTMYLMSELFIQMELKKDFKNKQNIKATAKGRKRVRSDECSDMDDKLDILKVILGVLKLPIRKLWDPPICEESFINLIAQVCYTLLQIPVIKTQKEVSNVIFHIFGILLKNYNYALTFSVRLTQIVKLKDNEHLISVIPNGVKMLVDDYNCSSLVRELVREFTEWQSDENFQDVPGTKHCSNILTELTDLMPNLMLAEVLYLQKYLNYSSYALRNCVLSVMGEVVVKVLSEEKMDEERKEIRDELLGYLSQHICDPHAHVRSRVLQTWSKLLAESAIPLSYMPDLVHKVMRRLHDKSAIVRKNAVNLLTCFMKYNPYSAKLDIEYYKKELDKELKKLEELRAQTSNFTMANIKKKEEEWMQIKDKVREAIEEVLENSDDVEEEQDPNTSLTSSSELIRMYLSNNQYKEAVQLCRFVEKSRQYEEALKEAKESGNEVNLYLECVHSIYVDFIRNSATLTEAENAEVSPDFVKSFMACQKTVEYITQLVMFLTIICESVPLVMDMLHSSTLGDVTEAIQFFVVANQFEIGFAEQGLTEMLHLIACNEKDRINAVIQAYKTVFLTVENTSERPMIIVNRLIKLVLSVTKTTVQYLSEIVSNWVKEDDIDSAIIELLWGKVTGRVPSESPDEVLGALHLMAMAAKGKISIVERNKELLAELIFSKLGRDDMRLAIIACQMLSTLGSYTVDVTKPSPNFRVRYDDELWNKLHDMLVNTFKKSDPFYSPTVSAAFELIFKLCGKPDKVCTRIVNSIMDLLAQESSDTPENAESVDSEHLAQFIHMLGIIAANYFVYLDVTVFKELKRRTYIQEHEKRKHRKSQRVNPDVSIRSVDISTASALLRTGNRGEDADDTTFIEGATADDSDAEFILRVLNSEVVTSNLLGHFVPMVVHILRHPHKFDNENLQAAAAMALLRFMSVTQSVCEEHLNFIMAIMQMDPYASVKINIIAGLSDLVHRYPNTIEPWSGKLYERLKDKNESVRMTAVSVLTSLLMEDMLRVKGTVADLALCIVDPNETIVEMSRHFFIALSKKGNTIYNILPDIISKLSNNEQQIEEDIFREVIGFLISMIDKDRQIEPLVEKLCLRLQLTDVPRQWRDIVYCLNLLHHNEKSLEKLSANFKIFKKCLEEEDIYKVFIGIVHKYKNHSKDEVKNAARKFEQYLSTGEAVENEETDLNETKKKPRQTRHKKRKS